MTDGGDDDPWGFLTERKRESRPTQTEAEAPPKPASERGYGEFRSEMHSEPVHGRAFPMALTLAVSSGAGILMEIVTVSELVTVYGVGSLLWLFPLGGLSLLAVALIQFRFIDHRARLAMLRGTGIGYAVASLVAFTMYSSQWNEEAAIVIAAGLGFQLSMLVPVIVWGLAGNEFNVAESRRVFGWISAFSFSGKILAMILAIVAPLIMPADQSMRWLLVVGPVASLAVGFYLPFALRKSPVAEGVAQDEGLVESLRNGWSFIQGVPVWRMLFIASILTFAAGMTVFLGFTASAFEVISARVIGTNDGQLQIYLGMVALASFVICWIIEAFFSDNLQERFESPTLLLILPIATLFAAIAVATGSLTSSLWVLAVGGALWLIPRWSIDAHARRTSIALVPDDRRSRVSLIVALVPVALGLIISGGLAYLGISLSIMWLVPALGAIAAIAAIPFGLEVRKDWNDSLLNWRIRRRKASRTFDLLDLDETPPAEPVAKVGKAGWKLRMGIRMKLLAGFAAAFTIVFLFIAVWVIQYTGQSTQDRLTNQLAGTALGAATTINSDTFTELVQTVPAAPDKTMSTGLGYPDSQLYRDVAMELYRVSDLVPEAFPASYFKDPDDGQLYTAAAAGYYYSPQIGVTYRVPLKTLVDPATYARMEKGLEEVTSAPPYTDAFGTWISAYAPIINNFGESVGAVRVDYPLAYVDEVKSSATATIYPALAIAYALLLLLVLLLSGAVVRPLKRLTEATEKVADGDYDIDLSELTETRFPDELAVLAATFSNMASKITARERSLTREVQRLRVEIDHTRREAAVKEITESDFFTDLTDKAADLRRRMKERDDKG